MVSVTHPQMSTGLQRVAKLCGGLTVTAKGKTVRYDADSKPITEPQERPLFIPLKREFYEAFERGEKEFEYREYGPRWNERTCRVGRAVTLSMGYGKARRLRGVVASFGTNATPALIPGWSACFGDNHRTAAVIGITIHHA